MEESIAIKIMVIIGQKFRKNENAPTQSDLLESMQAPEYAVDHVLGRLLKLGLVYVVDQEEVRYAPARSLDTLKLHEIIEKLRTFGTTESTREKGNRINRVVDEIQDKNERMLKKAFSDINIRDLIEKIEKG
jgi:membrane protein